MSTTTYFDQISLLLDDYYLIQPLRVRRNQVIKEIKAVCEKFIDLEKTISSQAEALKNQVAELNLPIEVLAEIPMSQAQINFMAEVEEQYAYFSEIYDVYEKELVELELEIILFQTHNSQTHQDLSAAA